MKALRTSASCHQKIVNGFLAAIRMWGYVEKKKIRLRGWCQVVKKTGAGAPNQPQNLGFDYPGVLGFTMRKKLKCI